MKNDKPRISRISIGRVYNLGNYEHVRYEVTVEIPPGVSAAKAVIGLERIVAGLKPDRSIQTPSDLASMERQIESMKKMTAEEWETRFRHAAGSRPEVIARYIDDLRKERKRREASVKRQERARKLFDSLNGAAVWRDAKLAWEDEQD